MERKITIDPITRVEGHGRVTIHLDEMGKVDNAYLHIVEFRGFERFIQGHPYWEAPTLVQRLCGICPVSHHLAAAKAIDQLVGIDPENLSPTATLLRRLMHYGQIFQSHALHFFYLASPDILFGLDAPTEKRNFFAVAMERPEMARKGILMRKFGQEIIKAISGKKIHGTAAIPGGMHKTFEPEERAYFLDGKAVPAIDTMIEWCLEVIGFIKSYHENHRTLLDTFAAYPSGHLGMVDSAGNMEMYHGKLRAIDSTGNITLPDIDTRQYPQYFAEGVERWSYMKFPYLKSIGREKGWNRVGPLARVNVCQAIPTPLAEKERQYYVAYSGQKVNNSTMYTHWARLIEMLHGAEVIKELLHDDAILGDDLVREGKPRTEGIGILEAPRGTLTHHYQVDEKGMITKCNLIVSTTHNNEPMNRAVRWVADQVISEKGAITGEMLNQIEAVVRAYDPCLSCATQALGQMALKVEVFNAQDELIDERTKS
ncbi:MAG: Ni/Fe hydrogenase subunit alpha [Saprospiraceae bacterium]|nr:Ni/Fe hydrogenase subunit alpha [Saprospiraceae bacterium]